MSGPALPLGLGVWFHVTATVIFACFASTSWAASQGLFPRLQNVGAFRTVSAAPAPATCGLPAPSTFCHSSAAAESVQLCRRRVCVQDCPHRSSPAVSLTGSTANAKPFSPRESQRRAAASREAVCSGSFPSCGLGLKCYMLIISSWFGCRNLRTKYDYNENPLLQSGKLHKFSYTHFERD